MSIFWLTTTNTIIIFFSAKSCWVDWVFLNHLVNFPMPLWVSQAFLPLLAKSDLRQSLSSSKLWLFFQLVRAAFCGRNQYILAPMLTLKWSHAFALNLKKKKFQKRTKESRDATASLYIQAKEIRTMKIFLQDYLSFNSCPMGRLPFERLTLWRLFSTSPKKEELIFSFSSRLWRRSCF